MAIVSAGTPCALCRQPLEKGDRIFCTWGAWLPQDDPLFSLCDAPVHWDCYAAWPARERFARTYFDFWVASEANDLHWHKVFKNERAFVTANPSEAIQSTWIVLASTGSRTSVRLADWAKWLDGDRDPGHPVEAAEFECVADTLRASLPSRDAVERAIDLERKRPLYERAQALRKEQARRNRERQAADRAHKDACRQLASRAHGVGISCPKCGIHGKDFALHELPGRRSVLICRNCKSSIQPGEFGAAST